jgi:A/G-specific adenine glycosylase
MKPRRDIEREMSRNTAQLDFMRDALLRWYRTHGRRFPWRSARRRIYVQVVSEILLQRTRAEVVARFWPTFVSQYPNWGSLASASEVELRNLLKPLGLARRRAAVLTRLGQEMHRRRGRFPRNREMLEALPGIGQYVANAALLFVHGVRSPLLDVNMARVIERCFGPRDLADIRYDPWLQRFANVLVDHPNAREINWSVLDLASGVCKLRRPNCPSCPLRTICLSAEGPVW